MDSSTLLTAEDALMNYFGLCPEAAVHTRGNRTDSACKAALVLGSRADVLRRRPAARRRRIYSAQALPFATCTPAQRVQGGPCTWVARQCPPPPARRSLFPSSLSTTSRAPRGQLLLLAVPSSCSSLPSAVPRAATDRADHAASVPPAALRTQSTRRADERQFTGRGGGPGRGRGNY